MTTIIPIDLFFQNHFEVIGAYLIPYPGGAVLVESGPGSTLANLQSSLREHGVDPRAVTHVLLTHIHLDHAGAAGWFASKGAWVYAHPLGLSHLAQPNRLLDSARRVYGDRMDALWGKFWPVSEANLAGLKDGEELQIGGLRFTAMHTPGHASHHISYFFEDACFSGDVGGVRLPQSASIRLPYVVPETDLGKWRDSLTRMRQAAPARIVPTHFGLSTDAVDHLGRALRLLDEQERWLEGAMADDPPVEQLRTRYRAWMQAHERDQGLSDNLRASYELANPVDLASDGLHRYWRKVRNAA